MMMTIATMNRCLATFNLINLSENDSVDLAVSRCLATLTTITIIRPLWSIFSIGNDSSLDVTNNLCLLPQSNCLAPNKYDLLCCCPYGSIYFNNISLNASPF